MKSYFVGIDVSKDTLDIWIRPINKHWKLPNGNFSELITVLKPLQPTMIVLEATGGYELAVLRALNESNFNVCREHPYKIHHHAKARGQLAKTDRVDAKTIAHYAECYHSELSNNHLPSSKAHELKQLVTRRHQLVSSEKNKLKAPSISDSVKASCQTLIDALSQQVREIEKQINSLFSTDPQWLRTKELLQSIVGVGETTAMTLMTNLPELGQVNRKSIAALAGVAPFRNESGQFKGQQCIRGGRYEVRTALYMATITAKRCNPEIKAFYERLRLQGKKPKVALVACMHKLLRILNALIAKNEPFKPQMT